MKAVVPITSSASSVVPMRPPSPAMAVDASWISSQARWKAISSMERTLPRAASVGFRR